MLVDLISGYLDWAGYVFILLGYFLLIGRRRAGWTWTALGSGCLIAFGLFTPEAGGVAAGNTVFLVIALVGFIKWSVKKS